MKNLREPHHFSNAATKVSLLRTPRNKRSVLAIRAALIVLSWATLLPGAYAADNGIDTMGDKNAGDQAGPAAPTAGKKSQDFWTRDSLFGDMGGVRPALLAYGITLLATENSEYFNNLRGGLRRGGAYDGLTTVTVGVDTQKALGIQGGTFNISMLDLHGRGITAGKLGTLNTASGIEGPASVRLWELWYQQAFAGQRVDVRVGQQSADQEFMVSDYAATFIGAALGWPALPSYDLPAGGPDYPLATPGVRIKAKLSPSLTALAAVYDGNPTGNDASNQSGTNFNLHNGALFIGELQYALHPAASGDTGSDANSAAAASANRAQGLPGTYKIGVWYNSTRYTDYGVTGANILTSGPGGSVLTRPDSTNYSFYAMADQMIWRPDPAKARSIGVFARVMTAPGDRNLVSLSANAGIVMKAPFASRDNDSLGFSVSYLKTGKGVYDFDMASRALAAGPWGVRSNETAVEATYIYQVTPWWQWQGDLQYTFNAGGGQNPVDAQRPLRNTFVAGLRTSLTF